MPDGQPVTVAVVDDDQGVRDSLRFLLETVGCTVDTFHSACHFLTSSPPPDARYLLVDQHMPRVTGLDLLRQLRDRGMNRVVALMTGSPSPELQRVAAELGAAMVIEKPLAEDVLLRFLDVTD